MKAAMKPRPDCATCTEPCKQPHFVILVACPHYSPDETALAFPVNDTSEEVDCFDADDCASCETDAGRRTSARPALRRAVCTVCGQQFRTASNRQQYCSEKCRKQATRRLERDKKRRQRQNSGS